MSSVIAMAAGGAAKTVGTYYASTGEKMALKMQAEMDEINAGLAEGRARDSLAKGEKQYQNSRLQTAALKGRQIAGYAANNVDLSFGSPVSVITSTDLLGDADADTIKANAVREAWGHKMDASNLRGSSRVNKATAGSINPGMNAFSSFLTEAGSVAGTWYGLNSVGAMGKNAIPTPAANTGRMGPY